MTRSAAGSRTVACAPWRRPPSGAPRGRRASWRSLWQNLPVVLACPAWIAGPAVLGFPSLGPQLGWQIPYAIASAAALGYGVLILISARRNQRARIWDRAWWAGSTPAAISLGLTLVVGLGDSYAAAHWMPSTWHPGAFILLWMSPMIVVCLGLGLTILLTNREVKEAISSGKAPAYWLSSDRRWWWDGDGWASLLVAAPAGALRAPGGNYWWAGYEWLPCPPLRRRRAQRGP